MRKRPWVNGALALATVLLCFAAGEGAVREIDDYPLFAWPLPLLHAPGPTGADAVTPAELDRVGLAPGVQRAWFFEDPPPLPNRHAPPAEWVKLYDDLNRTPAPQSKWQFTPADAFKAWNAVFLGDPCQQVALRHAPGRLFTYDPPDGQAAPMYRCLPDATLPNGLVTNQIGWRGRPIAEPRPANVVRIVFVGSSTVVDAPNFPFSHSDFVGHWLNLWAASHGHAVRFETLNAAREGLRSGDIAAVVHNEVLPLKPDLVLYYEGGNQFDLGSVVPPTADESAPPTERKAAPLWLRQASRYSALLDRVKEAIGLAARDWEGREWPKPEYELVWPAGLDEFDPDLSDPRLPVNLNTIEHDLDRIRTDLGSAGAAFAMSSFIWMVRDGMVLDPVRGRFALQQLNVQRYPYRYRDLERLAAFQNRVFAKYAATWHMPFVDLARLMPFDPELFSDAVHFSYGGTRLRGWIIFQQLLPVVEQHLADRSWPRPASADDRSPLPFTPRPITFSCPQPVTQ
jgi:hypothetical protein